MTIALNILDFPRDLPRANAHFSFLRKKQILDAVREKRVTQEEVMGYYSMSVQEFDLWVYLYETGGENALKQSHKRRRVP